MSKLDTLIAAAKAEQPGPNVKARGWASVQRAIEAGEPPMVDGSPEALTEALRGSSGLGVTAKIVLAVVLGGAGLVAAVAVTPDRADTVEPVLNAAALPELEPTSQPQPQPIEGPDPVQIESEPNELEVELVEIVDEPPEPKPPPVPPEDLAQTNALLLQVWAEIRDERYERALALEGKHRRRYPRSPLAQERTASRLVALCRLGRTDRAQGVFERFQRRYPDSIHSRRIRRECPALFEVRDDAE